jgi:hypothetical protein
LKSSNARATWLRATRGVVSRRRHARASARVDVCRVVAVSGG